MHTRFAADQEVKDSVCSSDGMNENMSTLAPRSMQWVPGVMSQKSEGIWRDIHLAYSHHLAYV